MATVRYVWTRGRPFVSSKVIRCITSSVYAAPVSRDASSLRGSQQELFSRALKALSLDQSDLDPRDRPRRNSATPINQLPIIHVKATGNNTIITVTDYKGRTLAWTSAGAEGFKNARRGTTFAAQSAGMSAGLKATALGINRVKVHLKGMGPGRQYSLKGLEAAGIDVAVIQDVTPIPHNGCKPRKQRRL